MKQLLFTGCLLLLLSSCSILAPRTGRGALFGTPEEAFVDALSPRGWLDIGLTQLVIHHMQATPGGTIALYSGYSGGRLVLGSADAKLKDNRWQAHGMFRLKVPGPSATGVLSCTLMRYQSSGASLMAVTGRVQSQQVRTVDVVIDTSTEERVAMRDGVFAFIDVQPVHLGELHALNQDGAIVERVPLSDCAIERS